MRIEKMTAVPPENVGEIVDGYVLDGSFEIIAKEDDSGSWEIIAKFHN